MRIAYLDCFSGISGDMFLGALVDAGVSSKLLEDVVVALNIGGRLEIKRAMRGGISATKVDVFADGEKDQPREAILEKNGAAFNHGHSHTHGHARGSHSQDGHNRDEHSGDDTSHVHHSHDDHTHGGRSLTEIRSTIQAAAIDEKAKALAVSIFENLGQAEAEIHCTSIERVHFHEVGAVDAMVDIVCAAVGAHSLAVDRWICSPLNVGGGTVQCAHGTLPVPAPATLKLLQGAPVYSSGPQVELVTPTGAAIVKTLCAEFAAFPAMNIEKAGYGAGTREFKDHPNLLRLTIGEAAAKPQDSATNAASSTHGLVSDTVVVLEANLDDLSPQVVAYATERLLAEGALDVFSVAVQMKKGRSGALLTVLAKPEDADRLMQTIFAETTTLGVRHCEESRQTLLRRWETVETNWGPVRIKIADMNGTVTNFAPEYEDCRALAAAHHVPLKEVMRLALQAYANANKS